MPEDKNSLTPLAAVLVWVLSVLIVAIEWLAVSVVSELWQVAIGITLVLLAAWLPRVTSAAPNPSIERDVQGLAPLAAPHVKR